MITKFIRKFYLRMYQLLGFGFLVGISGTIVVFFLLMLFFFFNSSWIAPTILSPTDIRMLQFAAGYQQAFQNIETLKVTESQAVRDFAYANANSQMLHALQQQMQTFTHDTDRTLGVRKDTDLSASYVLIKELEATRIATEKNVAAGLITRQDATQIISAIQQFRNTTTDGNIALNTMHLTTQAQSVQLTEQIIQGDNDVHTKQETLDAARRSLAVANDEFKTLTSTSFYRAYTNHGANLAFVPYDNLDSAKIGAPVYDCYLLVIVCRKVGTITQIYKDEQLVDFPIFNVRFTRVVRGVYLEMHMDRPDSMKSLIIFSGRKPFFL